MLLDADRSVLLIVDVQQRLLPAIDEGAHVLEHCLWLIRLARRMQVPIVASEHYAKGLGRTVPALRELLPAAGFVEKVFFSCVAENVLRRLPIFEREQWVVAGAEAHVCVLQTVVDLCTAGKAVFVVAEAVGSRRPADRDLALSRMARHGAEIVSREMVAFEWLERAGTDLFREINRDFIR
jgi:nicotinamidase-related amidase